VGANEAQATESDALTFVGRYTRHEVVMFSLYFLFRNQRIFYRLLAMLSCVGLAGIALAPHDILQHYLPHYSIAWRVGYFFAVVGLAILVGYLVRVIRVIATAEEQKHDATVVLSADRVMLSANGNSHSFDAAKLTFKRLPMGLVAFSERGGLVFALPFRAMSPDQRRKLEGLYNIRLG
jgi:MFS family permease